MKTIFTISVMEKIKPGIGDTTEYEHKSNIGWYSKKEDTISAVEQNTADIYEGTYNFAIIEEYKQGLYSIRISVQFFKYNPETNKYEKTEEPDCMKNTYGPFFQ